MFLRIAIRDRSAAEAWFSGDLGCRGKGRQPLYPLLSYVEARLIPSCRPCRHAVGCVFCA
jgi:hypothetical protein